MSVIESQISIGQIKAVREDAYLVHRGKDVKYNTGRYLRIYDDALPSFGGKKLSELIRDKVDHTPGGINVLDIGCGEGMIFAGLIGNAELNAFGISAVDYRSKTGPWAEVTSQIDYRTGDAQRLASVFAGVGFDIIASLYAFEYFADPLGVLKQAYRISREGGIILIDKFQRLTSSQADLLKAIWEQNGIKSELHRWAPVREGYDTPSMYSLAIQRGSNPRLPLPFKYSGRLCIKEVPIPFRDEMEMQMAYKTGILSYSFDTGAAAKSVRR